MIMVPLLQNGSRWGPGNGILAQVWFVISPLGPLTHLMVISEYIILMDILGVGFTLTLVPWPLG